VIVGVIKQCKEHHAIAVKDALSSNTPVVTLLTLKSILILQEVGWEKPIDEKS